MRESRTSGSVRGAHSNMCPYRDPYFPRMVESAHLVSIMMVGECLGRNLIVRRDWYFWKTPFTKYQPRLTSKFLARTHGWGYACSRDLLYDGAGVAAEMIAT
jgi:hypothetical protein